MKPCRGPAPSGNACAPPRRVGAGRRRGHRARDRARPERAGGRPPDGLSDRPLRRGARDLSRRRSTATPRAAPARSISAPTCSRPPGRPCARRSPAWSRTWPCARSRTTTAACSCSADERLLDAARPPRPGVDRPLVAGRRGGRRRADRPPGAPRTSTAAGRRTCTCSCSPRPGRPADRPARRRLPGRGGHLEERQPRSEPAAGPAGGRPRRAPHDRTCSSAGAR